MKELWNTLKTYFKMPGGFVDAFRRLRGVHYSRALENLQIRPSKCWAGFKEILATIRQRYLVPAWLAIFITLILGVVSLLDPHESLKIAKWTARKDFQKDCQSQKASNSTLSSECEKALEKPLPPPPGVKLERPKRSYPIRDMLRNGGQIYYNATSADGSVAYSPLEEKSLLLFLCAALIGGLVLYRTRTRIKRMLGSFPRMRPAESSPRMRISARSEVIKPSTGLSEGAGQYSTGLLHQPSSGLRHRNLADHALVEHLGGESQTNLHLSEEKLSDAGDTELQETTADAGDAEWQKSTADADEAEWQKFNLLSIDEGGIRGYWSLLALQSLMEFIGNEEEKEEIYHSFYPQEWPENVHQAPFTDQDHSREALRKIRRTQRYLPCHYFDYVCGSGCGALIAIMLGQLRMTVPDCLSEYVKLGHEVFGKPRMVSTMRFGLGDRAKYKDTRLEEMVQDVIKRHNGEPKKHQSEKVVFQSGRGLCATFVTTGIIDAHNRRADLHLIRSYDYERRHQVPLLEVWQVARAATAKKFLFEPMKIQGAVPMVFTDGPYTKNNPTRLGVREIGNLHGSNSLGIAVSVGTAHTREPDANRYFPTQEPDASRYFPTVTDAAQQVHERIQHVLEMHKESQYFRLYNAKGLKTGFDEWEPKGNPNSNKKAGSKTINDMDNAFTEWMAKAETRDQLRDCASALVARRRKRMSTRKWERYATGSVFFCRLRCVKGTFLDRDEFLCHLSEDHGLADSEVVDEVREARRQWQHQAEHKRGPAHAYQFGNTINVEDEDGEVVKRYDLPPQPKQRRGV